jgi:hypothetical protein
MCAAPAAAFAYDLPPRKPGLWQMSTSIGNGEAVTLQECVDPQNDKAMRSRLASAPRINCAERVAPKSGDTITIDATCALIGGQTATHHMVFTGSFDSNYTMTMTNQPPPGLPVLPTVTMTAKWLGPCAAGQRPGDMILPNGETINIPDLQKGAPAAPGAPMAPHQ